MGERLEIKALYIEPGIPWENEYVESFLSRFRDESLATEFFESLSAARKLNALWRNAPNNYRPHSSLKYVSPNEFAARCAPAADGSVLQQPQQTYLTRTHNGWHRHLLHVTAVKPDNQP